MYVLRAFRESPELVQILRGKGQRPDSPSSRVSCPRARPEEKVLRQGPLFLLQMWT